MSDDLSVVMERLGDATTAAVLSTLRAYDAAELTADELSDIIAAQTVRGMLDGEVAAVRDYAAEHYRALGAAPTGSLGADNLGASVVERDRLAVAARHIVTEPEALAAGAPDMRLERLARAEVATATQTQYTHTLTSERRGWRRGMNATACQLCRWWSRDGKVWRHDHKMPTHTGCTCRQVPVFTAATRSAESNDDDWEQYR